MAPKPKVVGRGKIREAKPVGKLKPKAKVKAKPGPTRAQLENANPLYDPAQQLAGTRLAGAARDLVNLEFTPREQALKRELANDTTQGTALAQRAGQYSQQVAANDAGLPAQQGAIKTLLDQSLGQNATAAQQVIDQNLGQVRERAAADAALRGISTPDATAGAETEARNASNLVAMNKQTSLDAGASSTAAYQQLSTLTAGAHAQMGQEVQGQLLNRLANQQADVRARQTDLGNQRGAAATKATTDLRQQAFENLITQQGLGIKTKELQAEIAKTTSANALANARIKETAKARRSRERIAADAVKSREKIAADARKTRERADRAARRGKANTPNEFGYSNREWVALTPQRRQQIAIDFARRRSAATRAPAKPKAPAKAKPMTQTAISMRTRIDSMLTDIGSDPKLSRHRNERGPRLVQILTKRGASPLEAQAAAEVARYGALRRNTEQALERAGIRIPPAWRSTETRVRRARRKAGAGSGNNPVARTGA